MKIKVSLEIVCEKQLENRLSLRKPDNFVENKLQDQQKTEKTITNF